MANPQVEDGFVRIASDIYRQLCRTRIAGQSRQVLDFIISKTWGWNKKKDAISLSQFVEGTGLCKRDICEARAALLKMNLITFIAQEGNDIAATYSIQKDFDKWKPFPKKGTFPNKGKSIPEEGNQSFPKTPPTIDTDTKDIKDTAILKEAFLALWSRYPRQIGGEDAFRRFIVTVKTEQDLSDINKALDNYLRSKVVVDGYIQNGSKWFGNWADWVNPPDQQVKKVEDRKWM